MYMYMLSIYIYTYMYMYRQSIQAYTYMYTYMHRLAHLILTCVGILTARGGAGQKYMCTMYLHIYLHIQMHMYALKKVAERQECLFKKKVRTRQEISKEMNL